MCVALPARVLSIGPPSDGTTPGRVQFHDGERSVDFALLPGASPGDHVVVHAGFAIRVVPAEVALETARLLGIDDGSQGEGG